MYCSACGRCARRMVGHGRASHARHAPAAEGRGLAHAPPRALLTPGRPPPRCPCSAASFEVGQSPSIKEAQAIADDIFADFVSMVRGLGWAG